MKHCVEHYNIKQEQQQASNIKQEITCITRKRIQVIGKVLGGLLEMIISKFLLDMEEFIFKQVLATYN